MVYARFKAVYGLRNENAWMNSKTIWFQKRKTGQFQNDLFSENENDLISGRNENDPFSAPIYKEEKGKRSNFTFKSSTSRRRPFYFIPGAFKKKFKLPHYNHTYIISRRRRIVKLISTNLAAELKKYNNWYIQLHIKCYSPSIYRVIVLLIYKSKASVLSIYRVKRVPSAESFQTLRGCGLVRPSLIYKAEVRSASKAFSSVH